MKPVIGKTTISLTIGISTLIAVGGIVASYYTSQNAQAEKINSVKTELTADVTVVKERVAKLEEAVSTIKSDTTEIKGDIKMILKAVK